MFNKFISICVKLHLFKRSSTACIMISTLLNSLLLTAVQSKIVYIKSIRDVDGQGIDCTSYMSIDKDIAALISRNFVANYCKGDKFELVVSKIYDEFMNKQTDPRYCFDKFRTRLTEFICEAKNNYFDKAKMEICLDMGLIVWFCIEQGNVFRSLDSGSNDFKNHQTFMKFYISSLCKYGVYKSVFDPFATIICNHNRSVFEEFSNYVSGFGRYVDSKYIKLLDKLQSNDDVTCIPYDIKPFSHYRTIIDYIMSKLHKTPCDDETYIVCTLDILEIIHEIKRHYNNNHAIANNCSKLSPGVLRFGSRILKDESTIAEKEGLTKIFSYCKLEQLYVLPENEFDVITDVFRLTKPDHASILEFYEALTEFHKSLEEFFDGKYQRLQNE